MRTLSAVFLCLLASVAGADDWPVIPPAELALKSPQIEPNADAEALLWDVHVAHEIGSGWVRTDMSHYVRIKVFTEAGRDRLGTVDIPYITGERIFDVAGRTTNPDGRTVELRKDSVYDRTVVKSGGVKVNNKSFALPALEVGSMIEYRWRDTIEDVITDHFRLEFQRDIPVHTVRYHVKPIDSQFFPYGMGSLSMHLRSSPFTKESDGFYVTSATGIPAHKEEPDMPPAVAVRPWMLVYYIPDSRDTPERYWQATGKRIYESYRDSLKVSSEMRAAAAEAVKGAEDDEGRLRKLFDYVTSEFENTLYETDEAEAGRPRDKENRTTLDTWKQRRGTPYDLTMLYIALAGALDYEARLARVATADFGGFDSRHMNTYFLRAYDAAVKVNGAWRFCDPASPLLPFGMLRWSEQGQWALVADPKRPELLTTPVAPPDASTTHREGTFKLAADGTLQGEVRLTYSGHSASGRKYRYRRQSPAEREEAVRKSVKDWYGASEVTAIAVDGFTGALPLTISYRLKIPGYAQRTGRRLFLESSFFARRDAARYSASERTHPVMFENAWSERDVITYELPEGFTLEQPEAPGGFKIADVAAYDTRMSASPDSSLLRYERTFDFGREGKLAFPVSAYSGLKQAFDRLYELDNHTLALREVSR